MEQHKISMVTANRFKRISMQMAICIFAVLTFSQCKPDTGRNVTGELIVIDVTKDYPEKKIYIQDIAKVEYIPLETNDNTLIRSTSWRIHVSDDYIIIRNPNDQGDVFVFDGKGKSKFSFNHKGQGPEEYNSIGSLAFDEKAKELFIFDRYSNSRKIIVYAEDGTFKRILTGLPEFREIELYNYDDETLLVYDNSYTHGAGMIELPKEYSHKPYLFMSKADGSIVDTMNTYLPVRLSSAAVWKGEHEGQPATFSIGMPITNNRSFGKDFIICDWSSDTIYRLTSQRELQPMIVRTPSMPDTDPKILISCYLATDKFMLLGIYEMNYEALKNGGNITHRQLIYDFETGEINQYRFVNRDIEEMPNVRMWEAITPENTGVSMHDVHFLFDRDEKGVITGDLKELLKSLDEDDNPVLVKIKFH